MLITLAVLVVAALIVGGATLAANIADRTVVAKTPPPARTAAPTPDANVISFTTNEGAGTLRVVDHGWLETTNEPASNGQYLQIELELVATEGEISYDPYYFQAFDVAGNTFDTAMEGSREPQIEIGTLEAGESVRGNIAFDIPRGTVTLLMSTDYNTVAAIKIAE